MGKLKVIECEYSELASLQPFANMRVGLKIQTTPETYDEDFINLIIEVKKRVNQALIQKKEEFEANKKAKIAAKKAQEEVIKVIPGEKK